MPASPIALPTSSSPPRASACRAGRPVTTATAATCVGELDQDVGGLGVDVGGLGVVHDRRQRAVEVQADHRGGGGAHQRGVPPLPLGRGELHGPSQPRTRAARRCAPAPRAGSGGVGGEDDRQPVGPHRVDRGRDPVDAEVEGQHLAAALSRWREVDGAWPGSCRTSCRSRRPASPRRGGVRGDAAGQAGDAGVVVDLDVDLAALDRRLALLDLLRLLRGRRRATPSASASASRRAAPTVVVISRSVGSWPWVATKAMPAMAIGDDAEHHDRGREDDAALVAGAGTGHAQTSKPRRRAERWRWRAARSRRSRRTSSGSASSASGRSISALSTW